MVHSPILGHSPGATAGGDHTMGVSKRNTGAYINMSNNHFGNHLYLYLSKHKVSK